MFRSLLVIGGIFCTTVVLAEAIMVAVLWLGGTLTAESLRDVRLTLQGNAETAPADLAAESQVEMPSHDEIHEARLMRILQLDARESELKILKRMTSDTANQLISDRQAFDQLRTQFRAELDRLLEQAHSEATEQTRAILLATPPEDAVERLMGLPADDAVELLQGLPEKTIARILQAFQANPKTAQRGQELFESLYRGEPKRTVIENALQQIDPSAREATRGGG